MDCMQCISWFTFEILVPIMASYGYCLLISHSKTRPKATTVEQTTQEGWHEGWCSVGRLMEGPRDLSVRAQGGLRGPRHQMSFSVLILLPSTPIQNLQKNVLTTLRPWCPNWWNWLKFKAWSHQLSFSFLDTRHPVKCSELIHQRNCVKDHSGSLYKSKKLVQIKY